MKNRHIRPCRTQLCPYVHDTSGVTRDHGIVVSVPNLLDLGAQDVTRQLRALQAVYPGAPTAGGGRLQDLHIQ